MELDLRRPSLILLGAWNPAIFQPGWIARHLLDYPEGQEVEAMSVISADRGGQAVTYIDELGFNVSNQRVELFVNTHNDDYINRLEAVALRIIQLLPHTPFGAFGINYCFIESDPDEGVLDSLKTRDGLDQQFRILNQNLTSSIQIDNAVLNLSRRPSESQVVFDFNYHHERIDPQNFQEQIIGKYSEYLDRSTALLRDVYNLEGYTISRHEFRQ